jgi:hypothetical protein
VAALTLALRRRIELSGEGRWLVVPLLCFSAAFAWRDSATLQLLNGLAAVVTLSLAALRSRSGQLRVQGLIDYGLSVVTTGAHALAGFFSLAFDEIKWKEIPRGRWSHTGLALVRGLALALPLLLVFGGLFMAADPMFEKIMQRAFNWNFESILTHALGFWFFFLVGAGLLHAALVSKPWWDPKETSPTGGRLGFVEVGTALGLLNVLFLAFVIVQFQYFFGGDRRVQVTNGLTYADYARHGFFELVTVTLLVLPVLLVAHWSLRRENARHELLFRVLAGTLIAQLGVIKVSALQRMLIYHQAYGMTELRFYTTAFMAWLAVVFLWFVATVLRGQRQRFAFGALVTALVAVGVLNRMDPDTFIVQANVARIAAAHRFDEAYVTSLSADSVPALVETLPMMSEAEQRNVAKAILSRWSPPASRDWRTWNWSRSRAWQVVRENRALLQAIVTPTKPAAASTPMAKAQGDEGVEPPISLAHANR